MFFSIGLQDVALGRFPRCFALQGEFLVIQMRGCFIGVLALF